MKIGDTTVTKIPPAQNVQCENECRSKAVAYLNGTPYCVDCLGKEQQLKWKRDGQFFENSAAERVYFDVVEKLS
jgi:hypothetical protein